MLKGQQAPACVVVSPEATYRGRQDVEFTTGVSVQTVGSKEICMHIVTIPPQGRTKPHYHGRESAIYALAGELGMQYGEGLREHVTLRQGQILYVPAGVPHVAHNSSDFVAFRGIVARSDPNEQESLVLYDPPDPEKTD